jgi:kumamolisin
MECLMRLEGLEIRSRLSVRLLALAALVAAVMIAAVRPTPARAAAGSPAPAGQQLQLVLPLVADQAGLQRFATAVDTPGSPDYGQYESIARLAARFGASQTTRRRVVRLLRAVGARDVRIDATGLFADARLSARRAHRLFGTASARVGGARAARHTAPASRISVPRSLRGLVTGVVGLDTTPVVQPPQVRGSVGGLFRDELTSPGSGYVCSTTTPCAGVPSGCPIATSAGGFTPNQYLSAYGFTTLEQAASAGRGERVALIEIDGFRTKDVDTFAHCFGLSVPKINGFGVGSVGKPLPPGGEATLDLEVLDAAAPGLKSIDVYESRSDAADTLMALTRPLQNPGFKPDVISASLGLCEAFTVQDVGNAGIRSAESALEEAAASGISFLAASGDDGSADCTSDGMPTNQLAVNFPASSPWTTAVGGTNFQLDAQNAIVSGSEVVWNDGTVVPGAAGGGGVSTLFARPAYQNAVVSGGRRAVPDVAMLADIAPGYTIYCSATPSCLNGHSPNPWQTVGGTSAATPLLAGGFALIDQLLRVHQLQPLGLANPLLYRIGGTASLVSQVFNDVTIGSNDVGPFVGGQPLGCCAAATGYDEASGWGSVNLGGLATQALASQPKIVNVGLSLPATQHPGAAGQISAVITCSGPCLVDAAAAIRIASHRPFVVHSRLYRLARAGTRTTTITFSGKQRTQIRMALAKHQRVLAGVQGAVVDPAGNVERRSRSIVVSINS